jgi:ADP-dependent NAD(P)H-hydrate dehydratase / NAD(P)H-hydrate epimerase
MRCILTASEIRAAEAACIEAGTSVETLMDRAGSAAAEAIRLYAGPLPALVVCGPGNNGGDGYVIARRMRDQGINVRVAAVGEPRSAAAAWARGLWDGDVEPLGLVAPAPILVDALFGTGLGRPLEVQVSEALNRLAASASVRIAIDLPSGVSTDNGELLSPVPDFDLTITFASLKPAHLLQPAARHMGRLIVAHIGIHASSRLFQIRAPQIPPPGPDDHKYSRGYVAVVQGDMPGASALSAAAALRAGAGYVRLAGATFLPNLLKAIVQGGDWDSSDSRIGALLVGPGLGRGASAASVLDDALQSPHPLVLDADALYLLPEHLDHLKQRKADTILTPHAAEFDHLFGDAPMSKVERARHAAARSGAVVLFKGADSVVAAPDGRAAIALPAPSWLASAGTGDVLGGIIAACRAREMEPFEAACAGMWLHGEAARRAGPGLVADDLLESLRGLIADCQ